MKYSKIYLAKEAIKHKGFISKIPDMFRMLKMWFKGTYKTKSRNILIPLLGLVYIISPVDFIPEIAIPFIGVLDDMAVLAFVLPKLIKEVDKFLLWEAESGKESKIINAEVVE